MNELDNGMDGQSNAPSIMIYQQDIHSCIIIQREVEGKMVENCGRWGNCDFLDLRRSNNRVSMNQIMIWMDRVLHLVSLYINRLSIAELLYRKKLKGKQWKIMGQ